METPQRIQDEFGEFLNRWETYFQESCMPNEDIVNDFMWGYGCQGEEIFNELLSILENRKQK